MTRAFRSTLVVLAGVVSWQVLADASPARGAEPATPATTTTTLTLYDRLGGGPALSAVVEDLLWRGVGDKRISA